MEIKSPAFLNNENIPKKYTCDGENVSPPLIFSDIPEDAQSLALIVFDPDAPGDGFTHWVVFNIEPSVEFIEENSIPEGAQLGLSDSGGEGYTGACPPSGTHRYFFSLYALDKKLALDEVEKISKEEIEQAMIGHKLEQADLIGLYHRS